MDASDAEVRALSSGELRGCASARPLCSAVPSVAPLCPLACGKCGAPATVLQIFGGVLAGFVGQEAERHFFFQKKERPRSAEGPASI